MKIGELARQTGVSVRMLRYYEEQGLLNPQRRESGYREYSENDVTIVERIAALSEAGLTLGTIRIVLPCISRDNKRFQPCPRVRPALQMELEKIQHKMEILSQSQAALKSYLEELPALAP